MRQTSWASGARGEVLLRPNTAAEEERGTFTFCVGTALESRWNRVGNWLFKTTLGVAEGLVEDVTSPEILHGRSTCLKVLGP